MGNDAVFSGSLNFLALADALQLLGSNGSSGILRLKIPHRSESGHIYLVNGNPADAATGALSGTDALYAMFGWLGGIFEFIPEDVRCENVIQKSRMEIILTALKMLDDGIIEIIDAEGEAQIETTDGDGAHSIPLIKGPLVDYWYIVDEESFEKGQKIVEQGKHGNWIWVVLEGIIEVRKETARGSLPIIRVGSGSFVGSLSSVITGRNVRSATTVALENTQLGVLDSQRLSNEFARLTPEFKAFLASLDRRLRQVTDKAVSAYEQEGHIEEFVSHQEPLVQQGSAMDRAFAITRGEVFVVRQTETGAVLLADLYKEDFFGKLPFLDVGHEPAAAAIYGSRDLETRPLDVSVLESEFNRLSPTFHNFIENLAACITATSSVACGLRDKNART